MSPWWAVATYVVALFTAGGLLRLVDPVAPTGSPSLLWLAPAIAAGLTWLVGRRALGIMLPAPVRRQQVIAHTILGVAAAGLLVALVALGVVLLPGDDVVMGPTLQTLALAVPLAFALELGWRGVLQPLVESRIARIWACVAVGVVWAAWRLEVDDEATSIVGTLVASIALSVLLGYLGNGSWWQRWITAGVVQSILSIGLALIAGTDPTGSASLVVAGASVVVAVAWMLMFRAAQRRRAARAVEQGS
ncbi:CPBP family glutamic-type intramembrane protease [Agrococcus jejuensis]|uniref:CAAX protease self-immunity n=1 Tax=Agrococcus jejuensis TaxID=399736 RepID=A0A1G8G0C5_9MICO|nr:CPBP family glutamic-type intramembrane protease [Agrococcus jejuensis]SDH87847.1 CAAX protease self-immunity [Agrococcus jejuensis]